eukprot:scaffold112761_cov46-Cyclotella_meneghiniana.AAC.4
MILALPLSSLGYLAGQSWESNTNSRDSTFEVMEQFDLNQCTDSILRPIRGSRGYHLVDRGPYGLDLKMLKVRWRQTVNHSFYAAEDASDDDDGDDDNGGGDDDLASDEEEEEESEISIDSLRCLKGLYRGISSSSSIEMIHMQNPMRFLSDDHSLPMLELSGDDAFSSLQERYEE